MTCRQCRHSHYSPYAGTLCGAVRWELVGLYWTAIYCDCRGLTAGNSKLGDVHH